MLVILDIAYILSTLVFVLFEGLDYKIWWHHFHFQHKITDYCRHDAYFLFLQFKFYGSNRTPYYVQIKSNEYASIYIYVYIYILYIYIYIQFNMSMLKELYIHISLTNCAIANFSEHYYSCKCLYISVLYFWQDKIFFVSGVFSSCHFLLKLVENCPKFVLFYILCMF